MVLFLLHSLICVFWHYQIKGRVWCIFSDSHLSTSDASPELMWTNLLELLRLKNWLLSLPNCLENNESSDWQEQLSKTIPGTFACSFIHLDLSICHELDITKRKKRKRYVGPRQNLPIVKFMFFLLLGLVLARQVLYPLSHAHNPFLQLFFK
jgi:hypothetical protein